MSLSCFYGNGYFMGLVQYFQYKQRISINDSNILSMCFFANNHINNVLVANINNQVTNDKCFHEAFQVTGLIKKNCIRVYKKQFSQYFKKLNVCNYSGIIILLFSLK